MATLQDIPIRFKQVTPTPTLIHALSTLPRPEQKTSPKIQEILSLFNDIKAGKNVNIALWEEIQLEPAEYDQLESEIHQDKLLEGYIQDKLRYDYNRETSRLVVRMPSTIHEYLIESIKLSIHDQLEEIRRGSGMASDFAQKIYPAGSATISLKQSKHDPDASFQHDDARYPGVILEVAYSQKLKNLDRLAHTYLSGSHANVQAVVGINLPYGGDCCRKATLSVWRTRVVRTDTGKKLRVVKEPADEEFRDAQGNLADNCGLQLRLKDFAYEELTQDIADREDELKISAQQLYEFLCAAETKTERGESRGEHSLPLGVEIEERESTPEEEIRSSDEMKYSRDEEKAAERVEKDDSDYEE
ncbi:hypothetical protein EJ08DRAFT_598800 [Tothia fuscella]|uniref:Uncharacterized protein n=1 Tax=Tothia fuscella TaxID=1048955 RepID=A0A9P4TTH4_9PEZI|nr:hypothetical protein EJ08DRAFT_598800 [Tothia fuscella]